MPVAPRAPVHAVARVVERVRPEAPGLDLGLGLGLKLGLGLGIGLGIGLGLGLGPACRRSSTPCASRRSAEGWPRGRRPPRRSGSGFGLGLGPGRRARVRGRVRVDHLEGFVLARLQHDVRPPAADAPVRRLAACDRWLAELHAVPRDCEACPARQAAPAASIDKARSITCMRTDGTWMVGQVGVDR